MLSNRPTEYQKQHSIVQRADGSISFAPINRFALTLPPELTSEIFLHCLPDDTKFILPEPASAPLLLCRICRQWRRIALATPGLWASLYIDLAWFFPEYPGLPGPTSLPGPADIDLGAFFRDWLSNARGMPLSLQVEDDPKYDSDEPIDSAGLRAVLRMIGQLSAQWKNMALRISPGYFCDAHPSDTSFLWLKELSVPQVQMSKTPWMSSIPWVQLTRFRSEMMSVSECVDVLRNGPNLVECAFSVFRQGSPVASLLPPLNLRDLAVTDETTDLLVENLLQHLTSPALRCFTLMFDTRRHVHHDISKSGLIAFASRSCTRLQKLTLCLLPTTEALLIQFLRSFPSVLTLRLQLRKATDDLIRHLKSDVELLPNLESFHIVQNLPRTTAPDVNGLLEMLATRCLESHHKARMRSFQFEHCCSTKMERLSTAMQQDPRFLSLKKHGVQVYVGVLRWHDDAPWHVFGS
ncbi:hypothetical protein B0H11DRAFT_2006298 [Mycena galericulata]|nr:hypothetical protein B0H11DRAFT_2006298 [Mycena galericulata]